MVGLSSLVFVGNLRYLSDFAFIDADKINQVQYYEHCLALLRSGGLIAIDNVLWDGKVADPEKKDKDTEAIRALNKHLLNDSRVDISMVAVGDGLYLCRKKQQSSVSNLAPSSPCSCYNGNFDSYFVS